MKQLSMLIINSKQNTYIYNNFLSLLTSKVNAIHYFFLIKYKINYTSIVYIWLVYDRANTFSKISTSTCTYKYI